MVRALLKLGADRSLQDHDYDATPLEWVQFGGLSAHGLHQLLEDAGRLPVPLAADM